MSFAANLNFFPLSLHPDVFDISNYEFCQINQAKFKISKVYNVHHQVAKIQGFIEHISEYVAKTQFLWKQFEASLILKSGMSILHQYSLYLYNKTNNSYICSQIPIAGQTAGPNGLKFFGDTHGWPGVSQAKKIRNFVFLTIFFQKIFKIDYY